MRKAIVTAIAAVAIAPAAVSADTICAPSDSPAGFYACASVTLAWNAGSLVLSVQNLDSWEDIGMTALAGGYRLVGIGLTSDPSIAGVYDGVTVGTSGVVGQVGNPAGFWSFETDLSGNLSVEAGADIDSGQRGGIVGCEAAGSMNQEHFRTCAALGYPGSVVFTFTSSSGGLTEAQFAATSWEYSLRGIAGPDDASFKCGPDATFDNDDPRLCIPGTTVTQVPEPLSMLLLGTGLVGVAGVVRRRRREGTDA